MIIISIVVTFIAIIATVAFGYLQIVVPFIKKEVRWSRKFPFIESTEVPVIRRRKKKKKHSKWLIAVTAVAVAVVIVVLFRVLLLQAADLPRKPIAVMTFKNLTGDEQYDYLCEAIPNLLITNLEQSERLQVMTWERMHDLLKQLDKEELEMIDEETGFELCRMDEVNTIVTGSFTKAGDLFVTDIKILDVSSKKLLKTAHSKGEGVASILKVQVDDLSRDIAKNANLFERTVASTKMQVMEVTTNSMDAYNYFIRGREDFEKHYYDDARRFLVKAIEIDTAFASAYFYLAMSNYYLRDDEACDKALEKSKILSSRVTEKERLYIEMEYVDIIEGDREKYYYAIQQLVRKYPKEKRVYLNMEIMYRDQELYNKAIDACKKALELDPNYADAWNKLGYNYSYIGDYAMAIECLKRYASLSPGDANPFDSMGDIYFAAGQIDEALAQYKEAIFVKPDFVTSMGKSVYLYALREDYVQAMKQLDSSIVIAPSTTIRVNAYCQKAYYRFLLGDFDRALVDLDTAEALLELSEYPKRAKVYVNWIRSWICYDQLDFKSSFDYVKKSHALLGKIPLYAIWCNYYFGLIEVEQKEFDSAYTRLTSIKSLLPDVHLQVLYDLLYAEVLLACDSLDRIIETGKRISEFKNDGYQILNGTRKFSISIMI